MSDLKQTVNDALDEAYVKVEEISGMDLDGDGVVGDGTQEGGGVFGKAKDAAERITGKDLDGDGIVGSGKNE